MNEQAEQSDVLTTVHRGDEGNILQLTINRPAVHNCVNGTAAAQLLNAWRRFQEDDSLLVAVLHGAGDKSFCSGADLTALESLASIGEATANSGELLKRGTGPMGDWPVQTKPVITVARATPMRRSGTVLSRTYSPGRAAGDVFCRLPAVGVPLVDGGTVYLPRLLGWGNALPLIITGERVSARRGLSILGWCGSWCPRGWA